MTLEREQNTLIRNRLRPGKNEIRAMLISSALFLLLFGAGYWLAGHAGTSAEQGSRKLFGWIVLLAVIFEFLDASAGMGYGTAMTPILFLMGFTPIQIVPAIMIQQAAAGLTGAFLHKEFQNVEWQIRPLSETVRLSLILTATGCLGTVLSITSAYWLFKVPIRWIKLYVALLLIVMAAVSLFHTKKQHIYHPRKMIFFGLLAGVNKGIGGGGYGPVVTIGGILSGVPVKTMMAVTALSEGLVCLVSIAVWAALLLKGAAVDFVLLPSMLLGSMIAAITAPYAVKIIPSRTWKWFVPAYSCLLAVYFFGKVIGNFF